MSLSLLLVVGLFAVTATYILTATQPGSVLIDERRPTETSDPAADTLAGSAAQTPAPAPASDWRLMSVTSLRDAEQLLDWLEAQGFADRELVILGNSNFAVRWR